MGQAGNFQTPTKAQSSVPAAAASSAQARDRRIEDAVETLYVSTMVLAGVESREKLSAKMMRLLRGVLKEVCAMHNVPLHPGPPAPPTDDDVEQADEAPAEAAPAVATETAEPLAEASSEEIAQPGSAAKIPEAEGLQS